MVVKHIGWVRMEVGFECGFWFCKNIEVRFTWLFICLGGLFSLWK